MLDLDYSHVLPCLVSVELGTNFRGLYMLGDHYQPRSALRGSPTPCLIVGRVLNDDYCTSQFYWPLSYISSCNSEIFPQVEENNLGQAHHLKIQEITGGSVAYL